MKKLLEVRVYKGSDLFEVDIYKMPYRHMVWISGVVRDGMHTNGQRYHGEDCRVVVTGSFGEFEKVELADAIEWGYTRCLLPECDP